MNIKSHHLQTLRFSLPRFWARSFWWKDYREPKIGEWITTKIVDREVSLSTAYPPPSWPRQHQVCFATSTWHRLASFVNPYQNPFNRPNTIFETNTTRTSEIICNFLWYVLIWWVFNKEILERVDGIDNIPDTLQHWRVRDTIFSHEVIWGRMPIEQLLKRCHCGQVVACTYLFVAVSFSWRSIV